MAEREGKPALPPQEVFRIEAEAEKRAAQLVAESQAGLENRCPECGALGSLEPFAGGELRCVDCDVKVAAVTQLGGFGRR
jgi:hypothetical protein